MLTKQDREVILRLNRPLYQKMASTTAVPPLERAIKNITKYGWTKGYHVRYKDKNIVGIDIEGAMMFQGSKMKTLVKDMPNVSLARNIIIDTWAYSHNDIRWLGVSGINDQRLKSKTQALALLKDALSIAKELDADYR